MSNNAASPSNVIQYVSINTTGNALYFGDLISPKLSVAGNSSSTRGLIAGGGFPGTGINYVTLNSLGNSITFGNLTVGRASLSACANETRCAFGGGRGFGVHDPSTSVIDYVTIASTGNAISFGSLTVSRITRSAFQSTTRGVYCGGGSGGTEINVMDYITIATTGNAIDFGDVTFPSDPSTTAGCSSNVRGLISSDNNGSNVIGFVTIASLGNTSDFGDLSVARRLATAASGRTRAIFAGGDQNGVTSINVMDFVTIGTTGNATDFGDLTNGSFTNAGCGFSSAHGGV